MAVPDVNGFYASHPHTKRHILVNSRWAKGLNITLLGYLLECDAPVGVLHYNKSDSETYL